jgi:hypothetical protein
MRNLLLVVPPCCCSNFEGTALFTKEHHPNHSKGVECVIMATINAMKKRAIPVDVPDSKSEAKIASLLQNPEVIIEHLPVTNLITA